jgi:acyl-CoA reductase-like NAD-dependent aldehyde dehydrogenase
MIDVKQREHRAELLARGADEWRDASSPVRVEAREALRGAIWSAPTVEIALDNVLWDLDEPRARSLCAHQTTLERRPVVVILPGNVIGPAISSAYCAAAAGSRAILKSARGERRLAEIVARQFDRLGPPLAGTLEPRYWQGGDEALEAVLLPSVRRVVAFGSSETFATLRPRVDAASFVGYGEAHSIGVVTAAADVKAAAFEAAKDVCLFDQAGCMSPQTIYVEGDDGRAVLFAHALAAALRKAGRNLVKGSPQIDEAAAVAAYVRHFAVTAVTPRTHGLDTVLIGPSLEGCPEFVVAVEASGPPTCAGFGRIVSIKPYRNPEELGVLVDRHTGDLDTAGTAGATAPELDAVLRHLLRRTCLLGNMQRPPFGYRPSIADFA